MIATLRTPLDRLRSGCADGSQPLKSATTETGWPASGRLKTTLVWPSRWRFFVIMVRVCRTRSARSRTPGFQFVNCPCYVGFDRWVPRLRLGLASLGQSVLARHGAALRRRFDRCDTHGVG